MVFKGVAFIICVTSGEVVRSVSIADVREADISGRGAVTTGGGVIGGGFGLEGAAIGMGIAAVLNALTTESHMETVLRVAMTDAEAFFHYGSATPDALRMTLSRFFATVRETAPTPALVEETSLAGELERLSTLKREGMLSDDEFSKAKQRLLGER